MDTIEANGAGMKVGPMMRGGGVDAQNDSGGLGSSLERLQRRERQRQAIRDSTRFQVRATLAFTVFFGAGAVLAAYYELPWSSWVWNAIGTAVLTGIVWGLSQFLTERLPDDMWDELWPSLLDGYKVLAPIRFRKSRRREL